MRIALARPKWLSLVAATAMMILAVLPDSALGRNPKIYVTVGQSVTQALSNDVKTVSIADSKVADVVVVGPREVLVNGKTVGLTTLVVWDDVRGSSVFDVVVQGPFSDQQIELRVKVAEINRTKAAEYGVDLFGTSKTNGDEVSGGTFGGQTDTPQIPLSIFGGGAVEGLSLAFRYVTEKSDFQAMVKAMMQNGILHVLAEPNVVAASGQSASFLSGGEIPVPIASSGTTGGSTVTIEWKEFGVRVDFLPTIVDSAVINLKVAPEVSSLDFNSGVQLSGFRIPGLRTRRAETTVELRDGEILVIGGLILEEENRVRTHIPILGQIPLLGWFFSSYTTSKSQSELILVVSPRITRALGPQSPMPELKSSFEEVK